jgi:glycosyltransferase involved in cell wall biosynthesis
MSEIDGIYSEDGCVGEPSSRSETPRRGQKLLFVSNLFPDSTAPYLGLDNATVLHELRLAHGWDLSVVCPRPTLSLNRLTRAEGGWKCRAQDAVLKPSFIPVPYVPRVGSRVNHQLMAARLRPLLKSMDFDVLLVSWLYPDGCALAMIARKMGKPCVLITQGSDTHQYLRQPVRRRLILHAITQTHGVIARSRDLARRLAEAGADAGKLHPIYNGVDLAVFRPQPQAAARAQLGLSADARIALFVGNFLDVKNPLMLVLAFADFVKSTPEKNNLLMMAGRGPMLDEVREHAATLGMADRVVLTGPLDSGQIALRMAAADFLCLSSRNEGLPNVILEAFACGLPVLSTDVGGISEVVNDPARGLLVTPGDQNAYTQGLKHMTATTWQRNVIAEFGARFSWKNAAAAYDVLLRPLTPCIESLSL